MNARRTCGLVLLGFLLLLPKAAPLTMPAGAQPLVLSVQPFLPPDELRRLFTPFAELLGQKLRQPIVIRIGRDYQNHIESIGQSHADFGLFGPAPYLRLTAAYGPKVILARLQGVGKPTFRGIVITSHTRPIQTLAELKGKRFAFGDRHSTASTIVPRLLLRKAGVRLADLGSYDHLSNLDNVALGVLAGDYDAGAVREITYDKYAGSGLRAIATTIPLPSDIFVVRDGLPPDDIKALRAALYSLNDSPRGHEVLQGIFSTRTEIAPASDGDYNQLRRILHPLLSQLL